MPVNFGDLVTVPRAAGSGDLVAVVWKQSTVWREEQYYLLRGQCRVGEPTQEQVVVFVQKDYFEDQSLPHQLAKLNVNLQGLRESEVSFRVDGKFQFGQESSGLNRFVVYHDKTREPYQHRFVPSFLVKVGNTLVDIVECLPIPGLEALIKGGYKLGKGQIGDPLKTFAAP